MNIATRLVRFDAAPGDPSRPSTTPLYQTATFVQGSPLEPSAYDYSRSGNPTRTVLEEQLAALEGARHAFALASGMTAIAAVAGLLRAGDEALLGDDLYGGTSRLFGTVLARRGVASTHADPIDARAFARHVTPRTRLVHVESATNPRLDLVDVAALRGALEARARELGCARPILCVDNTLLSPLELRPLELGADVVVHSATKVLAGHADVTAGVACTSRDDLAAEIAFTRNAEGSSLAPFEAWLLLRGLKTLSLRLERQRASARTLAAFLATRGELARVRAAGCVISFEVADEAAVGRLASRLSLFPVAVSFGSVGSSLCCPARMSHASIPDARRGLAPPAALVRLSIGIEAVDDLLSDLQRALDAEVSDRVRPFQEATWDSIAR